MPCILTATFIGFLENGIMVKDPIRLRKQYTSSIYFYIEIASVIPTDLLYFYFGINAPWLRFNRLLRYHRLTDFTERTEARTNVPNLFRVVKLISVIFIIYHWIGCFFYLMSRFAGIGIDPWAFNISYIIDPIFYPPNDDAVANYCKAGNLKF